MADRHSCHSAQGVRGSSASSALEQKLQFSLSLHQVAAAPQDAHHNKRITPRSARARTLNNTFREFPFLCGHTFLRDSFCLRLNGSLVYFFPITLNYLTPLRSYITVLFTDHYCLKKLSTCRASISARRAGVYKDTIISNTRITVY